MVKLRPLRAIRLKCVDCSAGQPKEVRLCQSDECPLFLYRFGKNPNRSGKGGFSRKSPTQLEITDVGSSV